MRRGPRACFGRHFGPTAVCLQKFHGEVSGPKHVFRTALAPWCRPAPALFRISETWAIVICMPSRGAVRGVEVFFWIFQRLTIYAGKSGRP